MKRVGNCKNCGSCCKANNLMKDLTWFEKAMLISAKGFSIFENLKDFRCPSLVYKKGKYYCKIHSKKPDFCQKYPNEPSDIVTKKCGFHFIKEE